MVLLCYVLGLVILHFCLRKCEERLRSILMVGYNYLVVVALYFWFRFPAGEGLTEIFYTLLLCMYEGIMALTFEGNPDLFGTPQYVCIFLIIVVYTIRAVLIVFFKSLINRMVMEWRLYLAKEIYLISGRQEDIEALAMDIHKHVKRAAIAYILSDEQEEEKEPVPGALRVEKDWIRKMKKDKTYHVILLPDSCHENIWYLQELDALGDKGAKLQVTAFLDNDLIRFEDLYFQNLDAYLVSSEQLLIRRILTEQLPLQYLKKRGLGKEKEGIFCPEVPFTVCVIGFGDLGKEYLLSTYENTAFETAAPDKSGLKALILDADLEEKRAELYRDAPQLKEESGIFWRETPYESEEFFEAIEELLGGLHQILIATGDTEANVELAMRLLRICRKRGMGESLPQMIVALHGEAEGSMMLLAHEKNVFFQKAGQGQFTYEELVLRKADEEAEALHRHYQGRNLHAKNWNTLGTFTQTSNRAVVWDIPNKLALAGDLDGLSKEERERVLWQLARYEHRRWNAFHYSRGWTKLPVAELSEEEREQCTTKRKQEKRHTCLVEWDELDALPQSEPGILKRYDYENVAQLFDFTL